jgi:hypothetical protein
MVKPHSKRWDHLIVSSYFMEQSQEGDSCSAGQKISHPKFHYDGQFIQVCDILSYASFILWLGVVIYPPNPQAGG